LARFSLFREELRRAAHELRGRALSPARGAAAVALGLFIGSQPIFGCHTPLVLGLCLVLRLDALICWVAANISNPLFAPALLTFEVQVGAYLRTGAFVRLEREIHRVSDLKAFTGDLFLGALLVGAALADSGGAHAAAFYLLLGAVPAAAVAALATAARTPGLKPIKAEPRDLFRRPLVPQELREFDAVVFDPPRQGAQAQALKLAASKVPVVVAVSCNAATFARDARLLIDGGYRLEAVVPVDQFRHTPHVELVAKFRR
jgi:uncharacterized protein (DUF2062 family)